jgi:ubiquinone/menaquinone biosynthesis C-methylase UbiE
VKDIFSRQSKHYAQFRPHYPQEVFDYLIKLTPGHDAAWDVATGNGQVALSLSPYFRKVMATDISEKQLEQAYQAPNIYYSRAPAEHTTFSNNSFDLITIGQAIHWFNFEAFYSEATRVAKKNAVLAAISYHLLTVDEPVDRIIRFLYESVLSGYWDPERRYVDEYYQTIPFPFKEVTVPSFKMKFEWKAENLLGFLSSWSAVQHYRSRTGRDPLELIKEDLHRVWNEGDSKAVSFPFFMRVGLIEK